MHFHQWKRRELITLLGGVAAWPLAARAEQSVRRIGVLMNLAEADREAQTRLAAFQRGLKQTGWIESRNVRLEIRWGAGDAARFRSYAAELVALPSDVILAASGAVMPALLQATRSVPIVFVQVADPAGAGYVASLARPGGNATGFTNIEFAMSGKWLELLRQIAPGVTRAAVLRDLAEHRPVGRAAGGGAVDGPGAVSGRRPGRRRDRAWHHRVRAHAERRVDRHGRRADGRTSRVDRRAGPAVYAYRYHAASGGLISYGPDTIDPYRRAAEYVDRIL